MTLKKFFMYAAAIFAIIILYRLIGCPFRLFIGVPCPGCGITRAWLLCLNGNFAKAFEMHPLFPLAVPLAALALLKVAGKGSGRMIMFAAAAIAVLFIGVYAVRMFFLFPDTEPLVFNNRSVIKIIIQKGRELL